jgi:hypothetical protein
MSARKKPAKKRKDISELAVSIVEKATGEQLRPKSPKKSKR